MLLWCELQCTRLVSRPRQHFLGRHNGLEMLCRSRHGYCCYYFFPWEPQIKNSGSQQVPSSILPSPHCTRIRRQFSGLTFSAVWLLSFTRPFPCPGLLLLRRTGSWGLGTRVRICGRGPPSLSEPRHAGDTLECSGNG